MLSKPIVLGRRQALDWVEKTLMQTRGRELAGNFNPLSIGELFWEQSQNWEIIAQKYAEEISQLCDNFVGDLLQELCPKDIYARIRFGHIQNVLKQRLHSSQAELKNIIPGKSLYPMTYNHYYTTTIQKVRSQRAQKKLEECIAEAATTATYYTYTSASYQPIMIDRLDKRLLKRLCSERITENMDDHSCSDALDCLHAYYKVALEMFTDIVPIQVIERHLISNLEEIFSPLRVSQISDAEIWSLASELEDVMKHQQNLEGREMVLEKGNEVFAGVLRANG